jgi:hypothetical protein
LFLKSIQIIRAISKIRENVSEKTVFYKENETTIIVSSVVI